MIDFNAKLGHWPYRPVQDADGLLRAMDMLGIERAAVSSLSAVHYFNPHDGNGELARVIAPHRDRFVFMAVLKPGFAGAVDDLRRCYGEYDMRGLVLHPQYHRYALDAPELEPLMEFMASLGLPVCVQAAMEDVRRQYDREIVPDLPPQAIGDFMRRWPGVNVVALGLKWGQPELLGQPWPDNGYFDTSNIEALFAIERLVDTHGADRILFGTHAPLFSPHANVAKLRAAEVTLEARETISRRTARRLLRL